MKELDVGASGGWLVWNDFRKNRSWGASLGNLWTVWVWSGRTLISPPCHFQIDSSLLSLLFFLHPFSLINFILVFRGSDPKEVCKSFPDIITRSQGFGRHMGKPRHPRHCFLEMEHNRKVNLHVQFTFELEMDLLDLPGRYRQGPGRHLLHRC